MADKTEERTPGHAMFGLTDTEQKRSAPPEPAPPPAPQTPPQVVYWQPPPTATSTGVKILPILVALLFIVSGITLYLVIKGQRQINDTASKQSDQLNLLTRRL